MSSYSYRDQKSRETPARHLYKCFPVLGRLLLVVVTPRGHASSKGPEEDAGVIRARRRRRTIACIVPQYISACNTLVELFVKSSRIRLKETCERDMPTCRHADMPTCGIRYSTFLHTASTRLCFTQQAPRPPAGRLRTCRSTENLYARAAVSRKRPVAVD